ncbi:MAG: retropepsin-like aspartic protease [Methyloglobulus sp.]
MTPITSLISVRNQLRLLLISALVLLALSAHAEDTDDLFSQIQALQNQNKIQITGLERIQNTDKVMTSGNLEQQVQQLFAAYNHIVSRNTKGQIERIVIINKKQKRKDNRIVLPTSPQGNHFTVSVALSGDGRIWQTVDMVIDTGADLVVLPESMIDQLGLTDSKFTPGKMQTANGIADAKIGLLQELKIAGESVENVEVAFIADQLLGENKLLGMSVLGRYQVNIDDKARLVTLIKK